MNILIYGLGKGTEICEKLLRGEHRIVGYTDSFSKISVYHGRPFYTRDSIINISYDVIVVTLFDLKAVETVCRNLIDEYRVPVNKILAFWYVQNHELFRHKLENYFLPRVEGIILGNSHATYGYLEKNLRYSTLNFSVPGQDLFYIKTVLEESIRLYGKKLCNLRYILIDLYDYYCCNIDVSKGKNYEYYLMCGGSMVAHHKDPYQYACNTISDYHIEIMRRLFCNIGRCVGTKLDEYNRWTHISPDVPLSWDNLCGKSIMVEYPETIEENIKVLGEMIRNIKDWNPNVNIIFSLLPRYISMEEKEAELQNVWKNKFFAVVDPLMNRYGIKFLNYKNRDEISTNHYFWYDICHLNTMGAGAMTELLNRDLENILEKRGKRI